MRATITLLLAAALAPVGATAAPAELGAPRREETRPLGTPILLGGETVMALLRDRAGFLWVGSRRGLTRYDGYDQVSYVHEVGNPDSLSDNTIRTIYEDREGGLWIGTNTGGLDRLDRATGKFSHFRHDARDPRSLSHDSVYAILEDRGGRLWVATQDGLNRLDRATGTFERFRHDPADPSSLAGDYVMALLEDRAGRIWIGTKGGGIGRLDPGAKGFSRYVHDPADPSSPTSNDVYALQEAPDGTLWLGMIHGVCRLDPVTGKSRAALADAGIEYANETVSAMAQPRPGILWVATWGYGIFEIDTATGASRPVVTDPVGTPQRAFRIAALLADASGAVWAGVWGGGAYRFRPGVGPFGVVKAGGPEGLSRGDVTAVLEDREGRLWAGTWGSGVDRLDPGATRFRSHNRGPAGEDINTVLGIAEDAGGRIWVATPDALFHLDPRTGERGSFVHDPANPSSVGRGYVRAILPDREGRLWVGTGEGGLSRLRPDGHGFDHFVSDPADPASISDDYVSVLLEDRKGTLWVGTRSRGLNAFDPVAGRASRFAPVAADPRSLSHHCVSSMLESRDGTLWIGTCGGGVDRVVRDPDGSTRFDRFTSAQGLVSDNVAGIVEDEDGSLWIATLEGLSRFVPRTRVFANFDVADGLPTAEFNQGAAARGRDRLWFGTNRGLVSVALGTRFPAPSPAPTRLTSVRTLKSPLAAPLEPWGLDALEIPYGEILSAQFAVLDFGSISRHRFAYRLAGLQEDWIELGAHREITFTSLEPGDYALTVRGRNGDGVWSESAPLRIRVVPPFWMTWWFRASGVAALLCVALAIHLARTSSLARRNRELLALKDARERALAEARASGEELQAAYERLRALTRRLEAAKEDERKRIARELHDEMGQALTAMKINLRLLASAPEGVGRAQRIEDSVALADRMISHVRSLSLDLRPPLLDEIGLEAALRAYLETQSSRSGLRLELRGGETAKGVPAEVEIAAFRVVQEAVTNVIRHAGTAAASIRLARDGRFLDVEIRDDGAGFDVERVLERAAGGHHLGLLGIRERVKGLGGTVEIRSAPGRGTVVSVRIPCDA